MRFTVVFLLVVSAFLVSIDAASRNMGSKVTTRGFPSVARSLTIDKRAHTPRLLRSDEDLDNEERGVFGTISVKILNAADDVRVAAWLKKGKPTDDIFKQLKFDKLDEVLDNKKLAIWFTYVKTFNERFPDRPITMTDPLIKQYGDGAVARMLEVARGDPNKRWMANKLVKEMGNGWRRDGKSPDDVFGLLNLDNAGDTLFSRRELGSWSYYTSYAASARGHDSYVYMLNILEKRFGSENLKRILDAAKPKDEELIELTTKLQSLMKKR